MGDVIAYMVFDVVYYAMFVLNNNLDLILWDMFSKSAISLWGIQSQIVGYYQYDSKENNFDLYLGIGDSKSATEIAGSTLEFKDFPVGWGNGADSHIRFDRQSESNCDAWCIFWGGAAAGDVIVRTSKLAKAFFEGSKVVVNPWYLGVDAVVIVVDYIRTFSPTDPLVMMEPGSTRITAPNPGLDFPK